MLTEFTAECYFEIHVVIEVAVFLNYLVVAIFENVSFCCKFELICTCDYSAGTLFISFKDFLTHLFEQIVLLFIFRKKAVI